MAPSTGPLIYASPNCRNSAKHKHPGIALIYVTEKTLDELADQRYVSPTDRGLLAALIKKIDAAGPAAIGLDFAFDRPTQEHKDNELISAIRDAHGPVVVGAINVMPSSPENGERFEDSFISQIHRPVGHFFFGEHHNRLAISDEAIREIGQPPDGSLVKNEFALAVIQAANSPIRPHTELISWLRKPTNGETFLTLEAETVLNADTLQSPIPITDLLKGRVVLIGGNFFDRDQHLTPFSLVEDERRFPGVYIHAQRVAQLLDGRSMSRPTGFWHFGIVLAAGVFGLWAGGVAGRWHLAIEFASLVGLFLIAMVSVPFGLLFPFNPAALGMLAGFAVGHLVRNEHVSAPTRSHTRLINRGTQSP